MKVPGKRMHAFSGRGLMAAAATTTMLAAPGLARAVDVTAADFFADCPGPIYISEDTNITGKAKVVGSCVVSVNETYDLALIGVGLKISGAFSVVGNAATLSLTDKTSISADGNLILDAKGPVTITESKLASKTDSLNIPPKDNVVIEDSDLEAADNLTIGGQGGVRSILSSTLIAGEHLVIAPGSVSNSMVASSVSIIDSVLHSADRITIGGSAQQVIEDSDLTADGPLAGFDSTITIAPGDSDPSSMVRTKLSAPNGTVEVGGSGFFTFEDVDVSAGAGEGLGYSNASVQLAPLGATATRLKAKADVGVVHLGGNGSWNCTDCSLDAGGASDSDGRGLYISPSGNVDLLRAKLRSRDGAIVVGPTGNVIITDSKLQSDAADSSGFAISVGPSGVRTIVNSQFKAKVGDINITGSNSATVTGSKFKAGQDDILFTGANEMSVLDSKISANQGNVLGPNYGDVEFGGNKIKAGGATGFTAESGNGATLTSVSTNTIKAPAVAIRSFHDTSAEGNKFGVDDEADIEISATGTCVSVDNDPDVPCL